MSKKYTTNFLEDTNGSTGSANQVLISTPSGIDWVDGSGSSIIGGPYLPLAGGTITGNLTVNGTTSIGNQLTFPYGSMGDYIYHTGDGNTYFGFPANDTFIVAASGTERMRINSSGNVGIGTTSPGAKLQVGETGVGDGNIVMKANGSGANAGAKLTFNMDIGGGNANSHIAQIVPISYDSLSSGTHNSLNFKVGTWNNNADAGVSRMTILSNGNIGIGTTDPGSARLAVIGGNVGIGTTSPTYKFEVSNGTQTGTFNPNSSGFMFLGSTSNHPLYFGVNDSTKMIINSSGNVGIGTTNPSKKLDVAGDWILDGITGGHFENYPWGSQLDISELTSGGWARANRIATSDSDAYVFSGVLGDTTTLTRAYWTIGSSSDATGYTYSNGIILLKNGNVGIGTISPYAFDTTATKLHVKNTGSSGSLSEIARFEGSSDADGSGGTIRLGTSNDRGIYFEGGRTGSVPYGKIGTTEYDGTKTLAITLDNTGNVGIGTTSPSQKLEVIGDDVSGPSITWKQTNRRSGYLYSDTAGVGIYDTALNNAGIYLANNSRMDFRVNGSERMRIDSTGNVGIGTTSPQQKLQVASPSYTSVVLGASYLSTNNNNFFEVGILANDGYLNLRNSGVVSTVHIDSDGDSYFNGGNVGIGTTSPETNLMIYDTVIEDPAEPGYATTGMFALNKSGQATLSMGVGANNTFWMSNVNRAFTGPNYYNISLNPLGGNVGIGTTSPASKLEVDGGDIEVDDSASGLILRSPNGTRYIIQVDNSGNLTTTAI
jgi:hypothetical protein